MKRKKFQGLTLTTSAATLKAMLAFIDHPENYDLAISDELVQRMQKELSGADAYGGSRPGRQPVGITFYRGEDEIVKQFLRLAESCQRVFATVVGIVSRALPEE